MSQRSALEQDVIEFAKSLEDIFEKQMELLRNLKEMMNAIFEKIETHENANTFTANQFGMNPIRLKHLERESARNNHSGNKAVSDLSI